MSPLPVERDLGDRLRRELAQRAPQGKRSRWWDKPDLFAQEAIKWDKGDKLASYQAGILAAIPREQRVCVRSLHTAGKTCTAALAVIWFAVTREAAGQDWKVITTAGAWRQLEQYLWPEIRLWARKLDWDVISKAGWRRGPFSESEEMLKLSLGLRHGAATAVASSDANYIEGAHAKHLFFVFDESKAIHPDIFDAAEGALASPNAMALAISTPGPPQGRFYKIHQREVGYEDWHCRHITLAEVIKAGRTTKEWAEKRARQWGEESAIYQNRVLGNFASSDEDSVIPLAWIEEANERWLELVDVLGRTEDGKVDFSALTMTDLGVDVARSGSDKTVLAPIYAGPAGEPVVGELRDFVKQSTMATAGNVVAMLSQNPGVRSVIDVIGLGAGTYDRVKEQGYINSVPFNASNKCFRRDHTREFGFVNMRSAAWWNLRELLDPAYGPTLALPPHDELIGDLCAPKVDVTSGGNYVVESKDDVKKRLKRSTDFADAVIQGCLWRPKKRRHAKMVFGGSAH